MKMKALDKLNKENVRKSKTKKNARGLFEQASGDIPTRGTEKAVENI